jgi:hypothetical protein
MTLSIPSLGIMTLSILYNMIILDPIKTTFSILTHNGWWAGVFELFEVVIETR